MKSKISGGSPVDEDGDQPQLALQVTTRTSLAIVSDKPAPGLRTFQLRADPKLLKSLKSAPPHSEYVPKDENPVNDAACGILHGDQRRRYFLPNGTVVPASMKSTVSHESNAIMQVDPMLCNVPNSNDMKLHKSPSNEPLNGRQSGSTDVAQVKKSANNEAASPRRSGSINVETARKSGSNIVKMARLSGTMDALYPRRSRTTVSTRHLLDGLMTPDEVPTGMPLHNISTTKGSSLGSRPTFSRPKDIPTLINEAHYGTDKEHFAAQDHDIKLRSQLVTAAKRQQQYRAAADVMAFHRFDWGADYWEDLGLGRRMPNQRNHGKPFWMEGTHFESTDAGETESSPSASQSGSSHTRYEEHHPRRYTDVGPRSMHRSMHRSAPRPSHMSLQMRGRLPSIPEDASFDMNMWLSGESPYSKSRRPESNRKPHSEPDRNAAPVHLQRRLSDKSRHEQRCTMPVSAGSSNKDSTATSPSIYSQVDGKEGNAGSECPRLKTFSFSSLGSVRTMKPTMYADETKQQSLASALGANIPHRSWAEGNGLDNGTARALDVRRQRQEAHLRQKELCTRYSHLVMASASR